MKFSELSIGQEFDFVIPGRSNSFFLTCTKISRRKYKDSNGVVHRVGSVSCSVHVEYPVPNFDGMWVDDIQAWFTAHKDADPSTIFADRPRDYVQAYKLLLEYAANKILAMNNRLGGSIQLALEYEGVCDSIYNRLPTFARW